MAGWLARLFGAGRPSRASGAAVPRASIPAPNLTPGSADWLVVGLGNPGPKYAQTRHNAGFDVVGRLADRLGVRLDARVDDAEVALAETRGVRVALARPQTFMNRSGGPTVALLQRLGLAPDRLLVVYDDLALDVGTLRVRPKGGGGGHNGIQDVLDEVADVFGSVETPRLRVGVGNSFAPGRQVEFVLAPFDADEQAAAAAAFDHAVEAVLAVVHDGVSTAMNQFNRRG